MERIEIEGLNLVVCWNCGHIDTHAAFKAAGDRCPVGADCQYYSGVRTISGEGMQALLGKAAAG